jgi:hypothetical protein
VSARVTALLLGKPTPGRSNSTEGVTGEKAGRHGDAGARYRHWRGHHHVQRAVRRLDRSVPYKDAGRLVLLSVRCEMRDARCGDA